MPKTASKMHIHDMVTIGTKSFRDRKERGGRGSRDRYLSQIPEI